MVFNTSNVPPLDQRKKSANFHILRRMFLTAKSKHISSINICVNDIQMFKN